MKKCIITNPCGWPNLQIAPFGIKVNLEVFVRSWSNL
jgi:hypothetical protein